MRLRGFPGRNPGNLSTAPPSVPGVRRLQILVSLLLSALVIPGVCSASMARVPVAKPTGGAVGLAKHSASPRVGPVAGSTSATATPVLPSTSSAAPVADPAILEEALLRLAPTLRPQVLRAALASWNALIARGEISRPTLAVIDYSLPSTVKRLWVFDTVSRRLLFHELVAHGRNSGENVATSFSNEDGSLMTSLGPFVTGGTYDGHNGYSLRLRGMDARLNGNAEARTIVVHGAPYVGEDVARQLGRLGRSHGCPALRPAIARAIIDEIKDGAFLYAWHPSIDVMIDCDSSQAAARPLPRGSRATRPVALPRPALAERSRRPVRAASRPS